MVIWKKLSVSHPAAVRIVAALTFVAVVEMVTVNFLDAP
jgi:hypothetical protein